MYCRAWPILAIVLAGCGQSQTPQVDSLTSIVDSLNSRVARLEFQKWLADFEGIAFLKPADGGYSTLKSDFGTLTVSLEDVAGYANGSKVVVQFGNTTSATIDGASATVEWGRVDSTDSPIYDKGNSKVVTFEKSLRAGSWTKMTVILDRIPPLELGFIRVKDFTNKGITLNR